MNKSIKFSVLIVTVLINLTFQQNLTALVSQVQSMFPQCGSTKNSITPNQTTDCTSDTSNVASNCCLIKASMNITNQKYISCGSVSKLAKDSVLKEYVLTGNSYGVSIDYSCSEVYYTISTALILSILALLF
jgi:hypothetical protein